MCCCIVNECVREEGHSDNAKFQFRLYAHFSETNKKCYCAVISSKNLKKYKYFRNKLQKKMCIMCFVQGNMLCIYLVVFFLNLIRIFMFGYIDFSGK